MLTIGSFQVKKVSKTIPYLGHVRFYEMPEDLLEEMEWLDKRDIDGVYQADGVDELFFIQRREIRFDGSLASHPVVDYLVEKYGRVEHDEEDDGPYGGAFASERDFWSWKEGKAFANSVIW